jgi:hypothetical protein
MEYHQIRTRKRRYFCRKNKAQSILDEQCTILVEARHIFPLYLCAVKLSKIKHGQSGIVQSNGIEFLINQSPA